MTGLPRRVLMTADAVGGVWRFSLDLARGLTAAGVAVDLAILGPAPSAEKLAEAAAVPGLSPEVTGLPLDWTADSERTVAVAARALARRARDADLIHLNHPAFAEASWRAPVVSVVHSCHGSWWATMRPEAPPPPDFRWRAERMRRSLAISDAVVAPSAAMARLLDGLYHPPRPVAVVRNGRAPAPLPRPPQVPAEAFVFTAGRLWDEAKNIATLDAAAGLIDTVVVAAGAIAGPNGEFVRPQNLALAGELPPAGMAARYAGARAFVSTARYEPFGLAVLEAAQAARPLVLSDIPTFRELWDGAALFAPPDDPEAVARRIQGVLDDPAGAERRAERAARRAARYTLAAMVDGYLREYAAVLARRPDRLAG